MLLPNVGSVYSKDEEFYESVQLCARTHFVHLLLVSGLEKENPC